MSSLPASPDPQKTRVSALGTKVRTLVTARIRTARSSPREPGGEPVSAARPTEKHPAPPAPRHREVAGVVVPDMPSAVPAPALPARIPYSEWKGPRPRAVRVAYALIMLAGCISLISGVQASRAPVTEMPPLVVQLGELGVDTGEYAAVLQFVTLAATLVVFGLYLLFASMIREGRNWARIGGSVLVASALVWAVLNAVVPQTVALLVAALGLALLYRRDCARYFRPRRSQYLGES